MVETVFAGDHLTLARTKSVKELRGNDPENSVHQIHADTGTFHLMMCYADVSFLRRYDTLRLFFTQCTFGTFTILFLRQRFHYNYK
jgi:hypothetical protein